MIYNPFTAIPARHASHVRGWAMHWASCLGVQIAIKGQSIADMPILYLEHGVNFGGSLNLFGGVSPELVANLEGLANYKGQVVSLDLPMPNYVEQLSKRLGQATCSSLLTKDLLSRLDARLANSTALTQADLKTDGVTIGDSHSTAFAPQGSSVLRTNGLTLHGALQKGHFVEQLGRLVHSPKRVTLVCGSIDIRHHIGRQADPEAALDQLCKQYSDLAKFIEFEYGVEVEIAAPVPVEYEGRKIPQTGFYKGTAFTGTQAQRSAWTKQFIDKMSEGHSMAKPPNDWYTMPSEQYADTYMEMNSSVHIAPMFYRRFDWGQL